MCNLADDTAFYTFDQYLSYLINRLQYDRLSVIEWFEKNHMKLNQVNHVLVSEHKHKIILPKIE